MIVVFLLEVRVTCTGVYSVPVPVRVGRKGTTKEYVSTDVCPRLDGYCDVASSVHT